MAIQNQEPQSTKRRNGKRFPWMLWIIVGIILIIILAFAVTALLIIKSQGLVQGSAILTPIYIVVGVAISLLGLLFAFLQWFYPRYIGEHHQPAHSDHPSPLISQVPPSPNQAMPLPKIKNFSIPDSKANQHSENSIEETSATVHTLHDLHHEDWGEAPRVGQFYGRKEELAELEQWIIGNRCQMVSVLGIGGIGKTTLAAQVAEKVAQEFNYVFWRSLQNTPPLEEILKSCISFLANNERIDLPEDVNGQIAKLMRYLRDYRCLIVLDNFESVMLANDRASGYKKGFEGYGKLLSCLGEVKHVSCLILTSREKSKEIARLEGNTLPVRSMQLLGLGQLEGREVLKDKGLFGSDESWAELISLYSGNPLSLKLVSEPIREVFGGDVTSFLKKGEIVFGDIHDLLEQQFHRMSELERELMYWLAIEREAVSLEDLQEDLVYPVSEGELLVAIGSLRRRSMIETSGIAHFTLQPVIIEYVTDVFVEQVDEEILSEAIRLFGSHALIKAQTKDYVRDSQIRLILKPVAERLLSTQGKASVEKKLNNLLSTLRDASPHIINYAVGNVLNILIQLGCDLRGYDFSHLVVWQAYLQGVALPNVNFASADLAKSVFTDTFGSIFSVALSPNGELLAAGTANGEVRLWDVASARPLDTYQVHTDWVRSVVFSPDSKAIAGASEDQTVRLWDISSGECLKTLQGHTNRVWSVVFSPDGKLLASASDDQTVRLWDVSSGKCLKTLLGHNGWAYSVAFSPNGKLLASGSEDQTVRLWEVNSGECLKTFQGHTNRVWSVVFSPDGKAVASASDDQTVRLWDVSSGKCLKTLHGYSNWVYSVSFSPDGELLASASDDQMVRLWEVNSGKCLRMLLGHTNRVRSVAFSPNGELLASGNEDQTVRLWEVRSGKCLKTLLGHTNRVWSVAFSPNGELLASGSDDQTVRLWEVRSGECLKTLQGHTNRVRSVVFSPDGKTVASASEDGTIKLWNVQKGECLKTLRSERPYESMNIADVRGLTEAQKATLKVLGAIEEV